MHDDDLQDDYLQDDDIQDDDEFEDDNRVNYTLRPAKNIERKMICETLRNLYIFGDIDEYQYVGFGSFFFADFSLFHKMLGIKNMKSIEGSRNKEKRCEFNKPFSCIDMLYGRSTKILPDIAWEYKTVVWMDYIYQINSTVLADLTTMVSHIMPGSVMIITVNASPNDASPDNNTKDDLRGTKKRLIENIGAENVPNEIKDKDFAGWGAAEVFHRIITNHIDKTIKTRNAGGASEYNICFNQIFNFNYQDGAKMLTVGGVFLKDTQQELFNESGFLKQKYIATTTEPYTIEAPILTSREIHYIDSKLPWKAIPEDLDFLPKSFLDAYKEVYRYFPFFTESEL